MAWESRRELFGANDPTAEWLAKTCGTSKRTAEDFYREITANCGDLTPLRQNAEGRTYTLPTRPVRPVPPVQTVALPTRPVRPVTVEERPVIVDSSGVRHVVPLDRYGVEIPVEMQGAFTGGTRTDIEDGVRNARNMLRRAMDERRQDCLAIRQETLVHLNTAYDYISAAQPWCVCRMCQGQGCKACHGRGWQTEEEYKRDPEDFKHKEVQQ